MPSDLESSIAFLESTNSPVNAYFSFTVDETGEYGIIKANKEGLRLYAAEMLKKSIELEQKQDGQPLFFGHLEWVVSDAGYDLIAGVIPQYQSRAEILDSRNTPLDEQHEKKPVAPEEEKPRRSGCLFSLLLWVTFGIILLAAHKAFLTCTYGRIFTR
ncbi:hypothetical protein Q4E93_28135 [Flavitalea sp. BT771]|uniref:hypothetical protein n=1 Tax=Flavitalea sp. BT771 TaxID=3063329 RepID=UPI0026E34A27|nr:hypothetical protein [Flavitalea sp. BT771]MDO6434514.1 hypothetical protein [Flavitalea sp. BT771]MDV6223414.1 hypothetical protein [Flavitalea sp. BT771]